MCGFSAIFVWSICGHLKPVTLENSLKKYDLPGQCTTNKDSITKHIAPRQRERERERGVTKNEFLWDSFSPSVSEHSMNPSL